MRNVLEVRADAALTRRRPAAQTANAVAISGFAFQPATITVKVGQTVTWTNRDPAQHTVTEQGGAFTSPVLASGSAYRRSFDRPGTYSYFCAIHPPMKGTVVVQL
jgi:plastocyanin